MVAKKNKKTVKKPVSPKILAWSEYVLSWFRYNALESASLSELWSWFGKLPGNSKQRKHIEKEHGKLTEWLFRRVIGRLKRNGFLVAVRGGSLHITPSGIDALAGTFSDLNVRTRSHHLAGSYLDAPVENAQTARYEQELKQWGGSEWEGHKQ